MNLHSPAITMDYYGAYSSEESDKSDVDDEDQANLDFERTRRANCRIMDKEDKFLEEVVSYPFLWRFKHTQSLDLNTWCQPDLSRRTIGHFYNQLDEATMRSIQVGIGMNPDYSLYSHEKKYHFTRKQLKVIFTLAADWMSLKRLGANDYINELCWVASKIIFVQIGSRMNNYPHV